MSNKSKTASGGKRVWGLDLGGTADYDILFTIDSREQKKLVPPPTMWWTPAYGEPPMLLRVGKVVEAMPFGDYGIRNHWHVVVADRKYSLDELAMNLQSGRAHEQARRFKRMVRECGHPLVFLDMAWAHAHPRLLRDPPAHSTWDALYRWQARYGFEVIGPVSARSEHTRRDATTHLIRVMLARIVRENAKNTAKKGLDNGRFVR